MIILPHENSWPQVFKNLFLLVYFLSKMKKSNIGLGPVKMAVGSTIDAVLTLKYSIRNYTKILMVA